MKMKILTHFTVLLMLIASTAFSQGTKTLVWAEEFNYEGAPNSEYWSYETGDHGWGNNELQNYTNSIENAFVKNGHLTIRAIKADEKWTSARLITRNKQDFLYGRIEASARLPRGRGTWPAIWMMPTDRAYGNWPECGEIDIMEHVGYDPAVVHGTVHTGAYNHLKDTQLGNSLNINGFNESFHVYAIEWTPDKIDFFIDDQKYFTFENDHKGDFMTWPFDKHFHLILNIAIGGGWGGRKGIDPALTEATMEVDYVRAYRF
ncbi:MAG: glycoside hydrolase family 16 protein [Lentimicrobium sp.]|jgi:beta-glucanase (GH16 family)|nr:glycoside hydrolase family 16 protein [Lentimicrobium sp.]MEA5109298.1 glycoside hydrolase family 16 protein [Lentimicrobium sp.]